MRNTRTDTELREISVVRDFCPCAHGSVLFGMGNTKVICAASVSDTVPEHAEKRGSGWLTANYTMLPYSVHPRIERPLFKKEGREVEIQRLIGRSLRGTIDLSKFSGHTIELDCDVLNADGGTRTAAITGSYIALKLAVQKMLAEGRIKEDPLITGVAAVSVGYVSGRLLLDLDFSEDSRADVDMNVIMNGGLDLIEVQGTGEKTAFTVKQLIDMVTLASNGIAELINIQKSIDNPQ